MGVYTEKTFIATCDRCNEQEVQCLEGDAVEDLDWPVYSQTAFVKAIRELGWTVGSSRTTCPPCAGVK